jgi:hypothetical protein
MPKNPTSPYLDLDPSGKLVLGDIFDRRRNGLYDRVLLKAGVKTPGEIVCFQRCVDQFTSWTETNMVYPGQLAAPQDAIVVRFLFLFQPVCADEDVAAFLRGYSWEFQVLQKIMQREPVLVCAVKGDMADLIEGFGKDDCNGTVRPYARPYSFFLGPSAIYLPPLYQFKLRIQGEPFTPKSDLDFYPILDGTIDRPVQ